MNRLRIGDLGLGALLSVFVLAINVVAVSSELGFIHKSRHVKESDHWRYISMARDPGRTRALSREDTYIWRVAVPAMARGLMTLGVNIHVAFWTLTNLFLFGFLLTTWIYLRDLGFETPYRDNVALRLRLAAHVQEVNDDLARVEQIKRFGVLDAAFSVETGELTPTLKVKRKVVIKKYGNLLDALYEKD